MIQFYDLFIGDKKITNADDISRAVEDISTNTQAISDIYDELDKLQNTESTPDSIRNIIAEYLSNISANDIEVIDASSYFTEDNVEDVLVELYEMISDTEDQGVVTATVDTDLLDYQAQYNFYQNNVNIAKITIPKDLHVTGGSIQDKSGTKYLVLETDDGDININVASLVDYLTGGNTAEVSITVNANTHLIGATINKISSSKVEYSTNVSVNDVIDELDSDKADKTELTSNNISTGSSDLQTDLRANATAIANINTTIGDTSGIESGDTLIDYIDNQISFDSLNSSVTAESGKAISGLTIEDGLITNADKINLTAQNISYDLNNSVKDKLDTLSSDLSSLETYIGNIPDDEQGNEQTLVEYVDSKVNSIELTAENVTVDDVAHNYDGIDKNVEAILAFLAVKSSFTEVEDDPNLKLFAFHYSENNSDPDSVTYPDGYANSNYTDPFYVNLSTGVPHYGDWADSKASFLFPKSCMLKYDGTVDYYLDENDNTKKLDGTASDVTNSSYGGNAMMEWAQEDETIYWGIYPDNDSKGFTFVVGNQAKDENMKPWNHYNCLNRVAKHWYTPKYVGSYSASNNILRSLSGYYPIYNKTIEQADQYAANNNLLPEYPIWGTETYVDWLFIQCMCVLISKSMNTSAKFGYGYDSDNRVSSGAMNTSGMFFGRGYQQNNRVKVFGMEDLWGNYQRPVRGLIADPGNGIIKCKLTYGQQDGSTVNGYNYNGTGYIYAGTYPEHIAGQEVGYVSHMNIGNKYLTPSVLSGTSTTYYCGKVFINAPTTILFCSLFGGCWDGISGVFSQSFTSKGNTAYGPSLSCKPYQ